MPPAMPFTLALGLQCTVLAVILGAQALLLHPKSCILQGLSRCAVVRQQNMCSSWGIWATCSELLNSSLDALRQSELQRFGPTWLLGQGDVPWCMAAHTCPLSLVQREHSIPLQASRRGLAMSDVPQLYSGVTRAAHNRKYKVLHSAVASAQGCSSRADRSARADRP